MTRKLFGTDGIRGTANQEPMTAQTALKVAMAAGVRYGWAFLALLPTAIAFGQAPPITVLWIWEVICKSQL